MSGINLTFKGTGGSAIPLEAEPIGPDLFRARDRKEIERLPLHHGNERVAIGDVFRIAGERSDDLRVEGDLARVKGLGSGMTGGTMVIEGHAGMHTGAGMSGGVLEVRGDAGDWAGAEMTGGLLWIRGAPAIGRARPTVAANTACGAASSSSTARAATRSAGTCAGG